ncbi:hypothetical protein ANO11243_010420 [Dothideomycetidae sp. 11243]|nr:hypothetical protein ANO11243_010420 [fungal sp. No.11243]
MPPLSILIIGGGVAGNALAFWLQRLGHRITVIERFPSLRDTGLQIDLRGHGMDVLKLMGLEEAFRACAAPETGMQIVDSDDRRWAYFPANKSGQGAQSFTSDLEIMRGDLCRLFYDKTKERTRYVFGQSVEEMHDNGEFVQVRFTNGETERFDLVVGADGQGSRTRRMMLGPDGKDGFVPLGGSYIGYFTMSQPMRKGDDYNASMYIGTGGRCMMTRRHNTTHLQVYLMCSTQSEDLRRAHRKDVEGEKAALTDIFLDAAWKAPQLLAALDSADDFYCEHLGVVKLDRWSKDRIVLLGDAAYCPSAMTGMGTTSALVGAYVLAGEIGRHCSSDEQGLSAALSGYEATFRPFMDQVQKGLVENAASRDKWWPKSGFGVYTLNCIMWTVSALRLDRLAQRVFPEGKIKWELPEYQELLKC